VTKAPKSSLAMLIKTPSSRRLAYQAGPAERPGRRRHRESHLACREGSRRQSQDRQVIASRLLALCPAMSYGGQRVGAVSVQTTHIVPEPAWSVSKGVLFCRTPTERVKGSLGAAKLGKVNDIEHFVVARAVGSCASGIKLAVHNAAPCALRLHDAGSIHSQKHVRKQVRTNAVSG
jgi:hypothetical protein